MDGSPNPAPANKKGRLSPPTPKTSLDTKFHTLPYIPEHAPEISFKSLQIVNAKLKNFKPDYAAVFTNKFVEAAHTKYPA